MKNIIKQTAKHNGVSVKEIRRELSEMIKVGMSSTDPEATEFWSQFGGKTPTPEQLITVLTAAVKEQITRSWVPVS